MQGIPASIDSLKPAVFHLPVTASAILHICIRKPVSIRSLSVAFPGKPDCCQLHPFRTFRRPSLFFLQNPNLLYRKLHILKGKGLSHDMLLPFRLCLQNFLLKLLFHFFFVQDTKGCYAESRYKKYCNGKNKESCGSFSARIGCCPSGLFLSLLFPVKASAPGTDPGIFPVIKSLAALKAFHGLIPLFYQIVLFCAFPLTMHQRLPCPTVPALFFIPFLIYMIQPLA